MKLSKCEICPFVLWALCCFAVATLAATTATQTATSTTTTDAPGTDQTTGQGTDSSTNSSVSASSSTSSVSSQTSVSSTTIVSTVSNSTLNSTNTSSTTQPSTSTTTPVPRLCKNGTCTGNDSSCINDTITDTCILTESHSCLQIVFINETDTYYEVGCSANCEYLLEEVTGITKTRRCCDTSLCNNELLPDPDLGNSAIKTSMSFTVLLLLITFRMFT